MSSNTRGLRRHPMGFSFIEVMVVVAIIGLLAGLVAIKARDYMDKAKLDRARSDIATIVNAVETYYINEGRYPANEQGLDVLPLKTTKDPWGRPYQYNHPGRDVDYEVISYGADGREGGVEADADISSRSLSE